MSNNLPDASGGGAYTPTTPEEITVTASFISDEEWQEIGDYIAKAMAEQPDKPAPIKFREFL